MKIKFIGMVKLLSLVTGIVASIVWWAYTPKVFEYAASQRMFNVLGGEIFYPIVPLMVLLIVYTAYVTVKENKVANHKR